MRTTIRPSQLKTAVPRNGAHDADRHSRGIARSAHLLGWRTISVPYQRSCGWSSQPRWLLTSDEDVTISAMLTVLRITRVLERIDAGISPQQYRILKLIGLGGERSARLAERLAVARPTLTATADSLVAAGLVCREAEPGDRRVVRLHLTEAGQAAIERADAAYGQWFGSLLDHTGRRDQIVADLLKLDESMTERRRARLAESAVAATAQSAGQR